VVRLVREPIDLAEFHSSTPRDGAVCVFVGVVRAENGGRPVRHLEYESFEEMALQQMNALEADVRLRWPVSELRMVHRLGRLEIGDASVAVTVSTPHRAQAFEACRFAIDTLKRTVPIWKKEFYEDGAVWLEGPGAAGPTPGS
jgi:molybdopterin synthase catalytic subunit